MQHEGTAGSALLGIYGPAAACTIHPLSAGSWHSLVAVISLPPAGLVAAAGYGPAAGPAAAVTAGWKDTAADRPAVSQDRGWR